MDTLNQIQHTNETLGNELFKIIQKDNDISYLEEEMQQSVHEKLYN